MTSILSIMILTALLALTGGCSHDFNHGLW